MNEPGLDGRHRDRSGEIDRKRSDTLLRTLRDTYGSRFGGNLPDTASLGDLLRQTGDDSLTQYLRRLRR